MAAFSKQLATLKAVLDYGVGVWDSLAVRHLFSGTDCMHVFLELVCDN
jgi:hypothetical protein